MKKIIKYIRILPVVLCCLLCGCAAESILDDVVRDYKVSEASVGEEYGESTSSKQSQATEVDSHTTTSGDGNGEDESGTAENDDTQREPEECFLSADAYEYARQYLNENELLWYQDISLGLGTLGKDIELDRKGIEAGLAEADIDRIFQCVLNDHPELFYVDGYSYTKYTRGDKLVSIKFSGSYIADEETVGERLARIDSAANEILAGISGDADQYTKVKYIYDTIIRNTEYDLSASDNQNIYSVFINRRSVCQGYAKAVQFLLNRLGMESTLVLGTVDTGEGHAWNLVKIDGSYYYLDATWGDASYKIDSNSAQGQQSMPEINYDYLNVTTEELLKTHTIDNCVPMPACVSRDANYYYREGAYFTAYDRNQVQALIEKARSQGRTDVTIKCSDEECYGEVINRLIEQQEIFDFLDSGNSIAYAQNNKQLSLTFWMTNG